jgi:uncharacterized protein YndB with AHSA1/START domain
MKPEIHPRSSAWRSRPMPERRAAIRVARRFRASPARVFDAWLDPAIARRWLFATATCPIEQMQIDARVGGSFRFVEQRYGEDVNYRGEYTEIVPHRRLSFILATDRNRHLVTRVRVEVSPLKSDGSALTLVHQDVPREHASHTRARWIGMLYGLGATLDLLALS